jgi:cell cycle arrest protein BUB3
MIVGVEKVLDAMRSTEVLIPPDEGISSVHFSPVDHLQFCTSTWSGSVHLYSASTCTELSAIQLSSPLLCSTWVTDQVIAAGSIEGPIFMTDGQSLIGHNSGVSSISFVPDLSAIVSGSWDGTVRIWDIRAPPDDNCTAIQLSERILTNEVSSNFFVIAHGNKNNVYIFDLRNPSHVEKRISSLGKQIRSSAASRPVDFGWAIGSIDGRIAVEYFGDIRHQAQRFSFSNQKHEEGDTLIVYPVNALCFHPQTGILTSGSCGGNIAFWDLEAKRKVTEIPSPFDVSVAALDYNGDGSILAIGFSYTWDKGEIDHPPDRLLLHFSGDTAGSA